MAISETFSQIALGVSYWIEEDKNRQQKMAGATSTPCDIIAHSPNEVFW